MGYTLFHIALAGGHLNLYFRAKCPSHATRDTNLSAIATGLYTVTVKNVPWGSWKYGSEVPIFAPLRKGGTAERPLK